MSSQFHLFGEAVGKRFAELSAGELFVVDLGEEDLFEAYLAAFPEGTNPIFRERTEHDCSCCKNFVRNLGRVVAIDPATGGLRTVWGGLPELPEPYATVAQEMDLLIASKQIKTVFRTKEGRYGNPQTIEVNQGQTITWRHFYGDIQRRHKATNPEEIRGGIEAIAQVLRRGLEEIPVSVIDTIIDLVEANALYRGEEHLGALKGFRELQVGYPTDPAARSVYVWSNLDNRNARFRNTVIGTLAVDLAAGEELERAVKAFETKVAPMNYKRPTALITPKMIEAAVETLKNEGLESAVERRFAKLSDVSVNNVLFVDNSVQSQMKDGLAGLLMDAVKPKAIDIKGAEEISGEEFFERIVPQAQTIELLLENRHLGNFMSLTAPAALDAARLFKWDNGFAWAYDGEVTDTITQKVKSAGGNINALLRISLAWFNFDDLDLHCEGPDGHIYYFNKQGILDVDMNAGHGSTREPVENLSWRTLRDGSYKVYVNQFSRRETKDVGFTIQFVYNGQRHEFTYDKAVSGNVQCFIFEVKRGEVVTFASATGLVGGNMPTDKWGLKTGQLVPVDTLMLSPNYWDGQGVGNKHWFFFLKGCKNPDAARGIFNEFLRSDLDKHRKVFEALGSRTKCPPSDEQLSGVGFSSTRGDKVTVVVKGAKINRAFNITF